MGRPRLLLVPSYTELEWVIAPQLAEWAEVATYDPPGIGEEPLPEGFDPEAMTAETLREAIVRRGLDELERRGWERCVIVVDGEGAPTAALVAGARPEAVQGMAIGHAAPSLRTEGERPARNPEVYAAMEQLLRTDAEAFVRHGIVQLTRGSIGEELAQRMIERFPMQIAPTLWERLHGDDVDIAGLVGEVGCPLLLAKHENCIGFTEEGWEDMVAAFPSARTVTVPEAPSVSDEFAAALRSFCAEIGAGTEAAELLDD